MKSWVRLAVVYVGLAVLSSALPVRATMLHCRELGGNIPAPVTDWR